MTVKTKEKTIAAFTAGTAPLSGCTSASAEAIELKISEGYIETMEDKTTIHGVSDM